MDDYISPGVWAPEEEAFWLRVDSAEAPPGSAVFKVKTKRFLRQLEDGTIEQSDTPFEEEEQKPIKWREFL